MRLPCFNPPASGHTGRPHLMPQHRQVGLCGRHRPTWTNTVTLPQPALSYKSTSVLFHRPLPWQPWSPRTENGPSPRWPGSAVPRGLQRRRPDPVSRCSGCDGRGLPSVCCVPTIPLCPSPQCSPPAVTESPCLSPCQPPPISPALSDRGSPRTPPVTQLPRGPSRPLLVPGGI